MFALKKKVEITLKKVLVHSFTSFFANTVFQYLYMAF